MNIRAQHTLLESNSKLVLFAFVVTVLFQITAYKYIWGIEWVSRLLNIAMIIMFSGYAVYALNKFKYNKNVFIFYIIPGFLVYIGFFVNISIESIFNINVINQYGALLPWAVYLVIPGLVKLGKLDVSSLWLYFNYFMLATVLISIAEYFLLFAGLIAPRPIVTSGGPFLAGYFSMLYEVKPGEFHDRFYASFLEPGTLAMFLLPVMAYAFLHRKYFSLIVFCLAMYMARSLGGFIGVAMLIPLLVYFRMNKGTLLRIAFSFFSIFLVGTFFAGDLIESYEGRANSREIREKNVSGTLKNLPNLIMNYPFGLPLTESTEQAQQNELFTGSNFTPGNAFNYGGILSFVGYVAILFVSLGYAIISLFRKSLTLDEKTAVVSIFILIPFIFQRNVVWDSPVFALLFAPFVIVFFTGRP